MQELVGQLKQLEQINPEFRNMRYFDCDSDPYSCSVFLVGINPSLGLTGQNDFWHYWDGSGFRHKQWIADYRHESLTKTGRSLKPTRQRIERLRELFQEQNLKMLNCNIYSTASKRAGSLGHNDRKLDVFTLLLNELKPKYIVLHGNEPRKVICRLSHTSDLEIVHWKRALIEFNGFTSKVLSTPHLFNMAMSAAKNKSRNIEQIVGKLLNDA